MPPAPLAATLGGVTVPVDVHRALADPTRASILDRLRESGADEDAAELAAAAGVHVNTARAHLSVLERAGLVRSCAEHRVLPGRPRRLWSAAPAPDETEHALLAEALVGVLEPVDDGASLAERAGEAWGHRLAVREAGGGGPLLRLEEMLARRGFAPELREEGLVMRRCPFSELAERHPRVVCGFHAGLIRGALHELGAPCRLDELHPFATADHRCVAVLVDVEA